MKNDTTSIQIGTTLECMLKLHTGRFSFGVKYCYNSKWKLSWTFVL